MEAKDISGSELEALYEIFGTGDISEMLYGEDGTELNSIIVQMEKK
jgi:hypothetical protein